jgi:PAS domain S-box-containing protein
LYFIWKTQARFLSGDYEEAVRAAAKAKPLLWSVPSFQEIPDYYYYTALALAARYPLVTADQQSADFETMLVLGARFRTWADSCAENFANKHALIGAEIARISGKTDEAMQLYEQAIRSARDNGFVQNEAIAYEVASRFFRQRGFEVIADAYLRESRSCYARWGADGKVRQLDRYYPHLRARRDDSGTGTVTTSPEQLDAISVTKASQAISREFVLPELLKTMLRLIVEQAGAQRGWLLLVRADQLSLVAAAEDGTNDVKLEPTYPVTDEQAFPLSVLNYVRRTGDTVALDDAAHRGRYVEDPYVIKYRPKSVLCLPIIRHAKSVGIIYLENNLTTHAFAADRLLVLQLLAAQAAISLENAQLYSDLQQQQAATRASQSLLQAIVDSSAAVIFLKDIQGRYLLVNRRYEEILHLTRDAIVGKTDYGVLPVAVADTVRANDEKVLQAGNTMEWEERIPLDDGFHTYLALKFPLRNADGELYGVCGIATDITTRKHGEESLKQAVRTRDEFLSVASHELRTPLTSMMLSLEVIRRSGGSGPKFERAFGAAWQGGERLQRLIEELLDISRIDSGQISLDRTEVELEDLVRKVVARFEPDIVRTDSPVVITGESPPVVGCWDRSRIDQVTANLLGNALKFGPGKPIEISITRSESSAILSVRDHGIGIDPVQQNRIFERFQRAVSERHYGGLGLGLYICHRIVRAHGGSIRVESSPGAGACFIVELPLGAGGRSREP